MLEMGKYGNPAIDGAASGGCSDTTASRKNVRAARIAAGQLWTSHRDIVTLKTRHASARRHSSGAGWRRRHDPSRRRSGRSILVFRSQPPRTDARRGIKSGKRSDGSTTRPGAVRATRRPSHDGPGKRLAHQERAGRANSTRIRNATQIGAAGRLGKFFSSL
jgi:hypothetical protein